MCNGNVAIYITIPSRQKQIYFAFYNNVNVFVKHLVFYWIYDLIIWSYSIIKQLQFCPFCMSHFQPTDGMASVQINVNHKVYTYSTKHTHKDSQLPQAPQTMHTINT